MGLPSKNQNMKGLPSRGLPSQHNGNRTINRSKRQLEREIKVLERQEAKSMKEIKNMAQKGQHAPAKIVSKDIASTRKVLDQYRTTAYQMNQMSPGVMQAALQPDMNAAQIVEVVKA